MLAESKDCEVGEIVKQSCWQSAGLEVCCVTNSLLIEDQLLLAPPAHESLAGGGWRGSIFSRTFMCSNC